MIQLNSFWKFGCIAGMVCIIHSAAGQALLDPKTQPQFVNPLPVPSVIDARNGGLFTIGISQFEQWLGLIDPVTQQRLQTTVWGYNGSYPGPSILAKKDMPVSIYWRNNLVNGLNQPLPHLLPIDTTVHWAMSGVPNWRQYGIPVVTHLHGGHTESASDGLPDAWFTPNFSRKGHGFIKGDAQPYYYQNDQEAATLWYHDHGLGITRLNVYAGLAGYYLLTDANETALQLGGKIPAAPYDLGLAIQDRMFTADGELFYPSGSEDDHRTQNISSEDEMPEPGIVAEFFGDFILVNGMSWPVLEVEPRQYRFRVLNGSDSRFYNLFLSAGNQITQIGTDNGLLAYPVTMNQMMIGPGERKDIILDFSQPSLWGNTIILKNNAKTPFPKGESVDPQTTGRIMAFRVNKPLDSNYPLTSLPVSLRSPIVPLQTSMQARKLILFEGTDEYGRLKPMLGTVEEGAIPWHDPITENPLLNSTEIWEIYNETVDAHPIHLHMVSTQIINRQKFSADIDEENGKPTNIRLLGQPKLPQADEIGWKDTWVMFPGEVTRIIAKFDLPGLYVWHCHILSHEDHEMMRPYYVGDMGQHKQVVKPARFPFIKSENELAVKVMPNPFSNIVTIEFEVPQPSTILVRLFDNKASLVKQVYRAEAGMGLQRVSIDGSALANGIYFCEIIVGKERILRKLVLQK